MINPYTDCTFFSFFLVLGRRIIDFLLGRQVVLVSDEVQMLVLTGVAASTALLGCFLILRKMAMLANSLSHTILLGIVLAYFLAAPQHAFHAELNIPSLLLASLAMGLITTFLTQFLTQSLHLQEDASLGLVSTTLFALGILAVTLLTRTAHIGLEAVMGNVDALRVQDCRFVFLILAMNLGLIFLFFKEFQITTFDPGLAHSLGFSPSIFSYLLMSQVAMTAIGAFRAVGVLMFLAFITGPVLTARLLTHDLKKMIALSMLIGCLASLTGVALARHFLSVHEMTFATGGLVVCVISALYGLVVIYHLYGHRFPKRHGWA